MRSVATAVELGSREPLYRLILASYRSHLQVYRLASNSTSASRKRELASI
jgi:hypothetical protein